MEKILSLIKKYKSIISYGIFGVLTTIVNLVIFNVCYYHVSLGNTVSNIIAWIIAVAFAYFTNKLWVFESKSWAWSILKKEITAFVGCRFTTGVMDVVLMIIFVDVLGWPAMLMKIISNILVIILNYVFSKLVIFKNR